jgi:mannosyltransferase OCH1-like enzyme
LPGNDQIPAELIQAGGEILLSAIHKLITYIWNQEEFPEQWKEANVLPFYKKLIKLAYKYCRISLLSAHTKLY